jgi:AcrR family transcriptional regulator
MSRKAESHVQTVVAAPPAPDAASSAPDPVRTRILRGAAKVFGERGYGATSVEAILDAAEVSRRTFYRTFRSKEDVLRTLFDNSVQRLLRAVRESAADRKSPRDPAAAVDAYLRVHANAGPLARVLLLEQFSPGSPLAEQRNRAFATFSKLMTQAAATSGRGGQLGRRSSEARDPAHPERALRRAGLTPLSARDRRALRCAAGIRTRASASPLACAASGSAPR